MPSPEITGRIIEYFNSRHAKVDPGLTYEEGRNPLSDRYFRRLREPRTFYRPFSYTEVPSVHLEHPHTQLGRLPNGELLLNVKEGEAAIVDMHAPVVLASHGFISCMGVAAILEGVGSLTGLHTLMLAHINYSNKMIAFNTLITTIRDQFSIVDLAVTKDSRKSGFAENGSVEDLEEILADRNQPPKINHLFYHDNPNWGGLIIDKAGGAFLGLVGESTDEANGRYVSRGQWGWIQTAEEYQSMRLAS